MPRPRKYKDNAARQAAYRKRLKAGKVGTAAAAGSDAGVVRSAMAAVRKGA